MSKLWEVSNGYGGNGYVRCLVIAETEELALVLAKGAFKLNRWGGDRPAGYSEESTGEPQKSHSAVYEQNLTAELLCDDTQSDWCGTVNDGS